jgi:hypothetical protein
MGFAAANVIAQEMGKTLAVSPFISTAVIAATALRHVSDARARDALARIASGEATYALAVDEGIKLILIARSWKPKKRERVHVER